MRQPFAKNAPSRTQALVFFSFGDPLNEAGEVSIVNAGEATDVTVTNIEAAEKLIKT